MATLIFMFGINIVHNNNESYQFSTARFVSYFLALTLFFMYISSLLINVVTILLTFFPDSFDSIFHKDFLKKMIGEMNHEIMKQDSFYWIVLLLYLFFLTTTIIPLFLFIFRKRISDCLYSKILKNHLLVDELDIENSILKSIRSEFQEFENVYVLKSYRKRCSIITYKGKPTILFDNNFLLSNVANQEYRIILMHELEHLKNKDHSFKAFFYAILSSVLLLYIYSLLFNFFHGILLGPSATKYMHGLLISNIAAIFRVLSISFVFSFLWNEIEKTTNLAIGIETEVNEILNNFHQKRPSKKMNLRLKNSVIGISLGILVSAISLHLMIYLMAPFFNHNFIRKAMTLSEYILIYFVVSYQIYSSFASFKKLFVFTFSFSFYLIIGVSFSAFIFCMLFLFIGTKEFILGMILSLIEHTIILIPLFSITFLFLILTKLIPSFRKPSLIYFSYLLPIILIISISNFISDLDLNEEPFKYDDGKVQFSIRTPKSWAGYSPDKLRDEEREGLLKTTNLGNTILYKYKYKKDVKVVFVKFFNTAMCHVEVLKENTFERSGKKYLRKQKYFVNKSSGISIMNSSTKKIGKNKFRIDAYINQKYELKTITVSTVCDGYVYKFMFYSAIKEFEQWEPVFSEMIKTIRLSVLADMKVAETKEVSEKAGFLTGLWHGVLWWFRLVGSFFWDIDVYADNNTGMGYGIGFFIGFVFITFGGKKAVKK